MLPPAMELECESMQRRNLCRRHHNDPSRDVRGDQEIAVGGEVGAADTATGAKHARCLCSAQLNVLLTKPSLKVAAPSRCVVVRPKPRCFHHGSQVTNSASESARMLRWRPEYPPDGKVKVPFTLACPPPLSRSKSSAAPGADFGM